MHTHVAAAFATALALSACAATPKHFEAESLRIADPEGRGSVEIGVVGDLLTAGSPSVVLRDETGDVRAWLGLVGVEGHGTTPGLFLFGHDPVQEVQVLLMPDEDGRGGLLVRQVRVPGRGPDGEECVGVFIGPDYMELVGHDGRTRIPLASLADVYRL